MKERMVVRKLRELKEILDECCVAYWLDYGTLLGAYRDGKIIEWDYDIDLGAWYNEKAITSTISQLKRSGFNIREQSKYHIEIILDHQMTDEIYKIDINIYYKIGNKVVIVQILGRKSIKRLMNESYKIYLRLDRTFVISRTLTRIFTFFSLILPTTFKQKLSKMLRKIYLEKSPYRYIPQVIPKHHFEKLSSFNFYGLEFNIPSDVEKYLELHYGNWKIPEKKSSYYWRDDGAIDLNYLITHFLLRIE